MQLFHNIIQKIKCHKNEKEESDHFDRFSAVGCTGAVLVNIYFTLINTEGERYYWRWSAGSALQGDEVYPLQSSEGGEQVTVVHPSRAGDDEVRLRYQGRGVDPDGGEVGEWKMGAESYLV